MTNTTRSALFFAVITAACGTVEDAPTDPTDPTEPGDPTDPETPDAGMPQEPDAPPPPPPTLLVEDPVAASGPTSLFEKSFANTAYFKNLIVEVADPTHDVVEQSFVTAVDEVIQLVIELDAPTGTWTRTVVSDTVQGGQNFDRVLCETGSIATFDPKCETGPGPSSQTPASGALTSTLWGMRVIDEATGDEIDGCLSPAPRKLQCVLPKKAGARYRVVGAVHGVKDLWHAPAVGAHMLAGASFTGMIATTKEWGCYQWSQSGSSRYCTHRNEFTRFFALDKATLAIDPMTIRITANDQTFTAASPAMTWDAGDDDLPGYY